MRERKKEKKREREEKECVSEKERVKWAMVIIGYRSLFSIKQTIFPSFFLLFLRGFENWQDDNKNLKSRFTYLQ